MTTHAIRTSHGSHPGHRSPPRILAALATYVVGTGAVLGRLTLLGARVVARGFLGALIVLFVAGTVGMVVAWLGSLVGGLAGAVIDIPLPERWELGDAWVSLGIVVTVSYIGGAVSYDLIRRRRSGADFGIARRIRSVWGLVGVALAQASVDRSAAAAINDTLYRVRDRDLIRVEGRRPASRWAGTMTPGVARPAYAWPAAVLLGSTPRHRRRLEEPEFTIEPFVGWRRWSVAPHPSARDQFDPVLTGVVVPTLWEEPEMQASCSPYQRWPLWGPVPAAHPAPDLDCRCGIYAMKSPEGTNWAEVGVWAEGPVRLWGRVLQGTKGYRADRARILGPLVVRMGCRWPCTPETWLANACPEPPAMVVVEPDEYVPLCQEHAGVISAPQLSLTEFEEMVKAALAGRYGVEMRGKAAWT